MRFGYLHSAIEFERSFSCVRTLLDTGTAESERLKSEALELAKVTPLSPEQALWRLADRLIQERLIGCP